MQPEIYVFKCGLFSSIDAYLSVKSSGNLEVTLYLIYGADSSHFSDHISGDLKFLF